MTLISYAEMVYFQFYRKLEEVDYFLTSVLVVANEYTAASAFERVQLHNRAQYNFSAFVSALISCWEITKVSIQVDNQLGSRSIRNGIVGERILESDQTKFASYFGDSDEQVFASFKFVKNARNANSHDGSLALNSGDAFEFKFGSDLHRYTLGRSEVFILETVSSPVEDAVSCMFNAAIRLAPLFEKKLRKPTITTEQHYELAEFKLRSIKGLPEVPADVWMQMIEGMVAAQIQGPPQEPSTVSVVDSWRRLYSEYRQHIQVCRAQS